MVVLALVVIGIIGVVRPELVTPKASREDQVALKISRSAYAMVIVLGALLFLIMNMRNWTKSLTPMLIAAAAMGVLMAVAGILFLRMRDRFVEQGLEVSEKQAKRLRMNGIVFIILGAFLVVAMLVLAFL